MENESFRFNVGHFGCLAIRDTDDWEMNILLVNTGRHQVLIDTGCGNTISPAGRLVERLHAVGISPPDIDVVILTHADFDHIGGAVDQQDIPAFPNARYVLARREWAFWAAKPERLRPSDAYDEAFRQLVQEVGERRLAQLQHRLELIDSDGEVVAGIHLLAAPGHTPGYLVVVVSSAGKQLMYIGDLIRDANDIESDSWHSVYDFDPEQVVETQQRLLAQASKEQMLVMASHLPFPGLGYVAQHERAWRWEPLEAGE